MEPGDVGHCRVVLNLDSTSELNVDSIEIDSQFSGAVESGVELEVDGAKNTDFLSSLIRSEVLKLGAVEMDINDGVVAVLVSEG